MKKLFLLASICLAATVANAQTAKISQLPAVTGSFIHDSLLYAVVHNGVTKKIRGYQIKAALLIDTTGKFVNYITKNAAGDSFYIFKGAARYSEPDRYSSALITHDTSFWRRLLKYTAINATSGYIDVDSCFYRVNRRGDSLVFHFLTETQTDDSIAVYAAGANYWTASGNNIYKNNSGNVGIQITSPTEKLHMGGNILIDDGGTGAEGGSYALKFRGEAATGVFQTASWYFDSFSAGPSMVAVVNGSNAMSVFPTQILANGGAFGSVISGGTTLFANSTTNGIKVRQYYDQVSGDLFRISNSISGVEDPKFNMTYDGRVTVGPTVVVPSALMTLNSTTQGFLPPKMTQAQRNAISSPATGLTLYCTDCTATDTSTGVMQTYNGAVWKNNW